MDKKNPMDPIGPPEQNSNNTIFNNQTPKPNPEQGNPQAFTNQNKNFDDIAARILEEAPPVIQTNNQNSNLANQPNTGPAFNTPQDQIPTGQMNMPDTNVQVGGSFNKFLNWKIITISIFGILLLTIGGISAFKGDLYWIRDLVGMGIPSDPKKAIQKAETNTAQLESYKTNLGINISGEFDQSEMKISTNMDVSEKPKEKKAHVKLNSMEVNLPEELSGGTDLDEINNSVSGIEAISNNNTVYVKVPSLNEDWYEIDESSIKEIQQMNNFIPSVFSMEKDNTQNPLTAAVVYAASSGEETSNIYNYLTKIKKVKDEKIDGKSAYRYEAEIDIAKALGSTGEVPAGYSTFMDKYLKTKVDIWVTKKEMVFAKMSIGLIIDMDLTEFGAMGSIKIDMNMDMKMSDFNKEVKIDLPTDAKKFDEKVFEDILAGSPVDVADSRNTQRKADAKVIESALESYYADNNSYPVTTTDSKNGEFIKELLDGKYLASSAKDPSHPSYYYSYTSIDGKGYTLTYVEESDTGITVQKITR